MERAHAGKRGFQRVQLASVKPAQVVDPVLLGLRTQFLQQRDLILPRGD